MAASNPLHRDASASRQPSTHSLHCFTACNAALPSHKIEGLVGPLRPWSSSRSCGAPPRPPSLPFEHALRAAIQTKMGARGRSLRVRPCHRILQATTMRRTAGIENKMRTRVWRREKEKTWVLQSRRHRPTDPPTRDKGWTHQRGAHHADRPTHQEPLTRSHPLPGYAVVSCALPSW